MSSVSPHSFGAQLKSLREAAGFTQEELATIAGLSVHAVSALERGERRRPHVETVRALCAALDLNGAARDALLESSRAPAKNEALEDVNGTPLPLPLTTLLGRDADVKLLRGWLADPLARLITLIGPGGVGKTRLALEIARAVSADANTRVLFVPLAATTNAAFVASSIADAFGLCDVTVADLPRRARVACADRSTLLVLDNFEHVLDAAPLAADLLSSIPCLRLLATSRSPLRVRGEREYFVEPLGLDACADTLPPADLARCPAVRLFVERVRDVQPDFRLTTANSRTVAAICRRLDALPLAIELAAPWMKALTEDELLRRLRHDVLLPTVVPMDLPERQRTMNATVAWSYRLLAPHEQCAFRHLGALPGRFSIDAAALVLAGRNEIPARSDDALSAIAGLLDKSLLMRAETSVATRPLYQMLETVRTYAALELAASGERDAALDALARYCMAEAAAAEAGLLGPAQVEWLERVRDDLDLYRGALEWLISRGRAADACSIVSNLMFFWAIRGRATEGLRWCEQVMSLGSLSAAAESRLLLTSAVLRYTRGELEHARRALARARPLAREAGDVNVGVQADNLLGHVQYAVGNMNAARTLFTGSAEKFRDLGTKWGTGNALCGMAWVALATGDPGLAEHLLDEATEVLQHAGSWFMLLALYVRATLAVRRGNADAALGLLRESLIRIRALKDRFAFVYMLGPLAAAAALKKDDACAARILGARAAVTERTGARAIDQALDDLTAETELGVRARLGSYKWSRAYAAGETTSIDALLKHIDRVMARPTPRL